MTDLQTSRLRLHAIDAAEGERIVARRPGDGDAWAEDYPFDGDVIGVTAFLKGWATYGDQRPFGHYRISRSSDGKAIGGIGFKGRPDNGRVEIGYGLSPSARGHGYAAEAVAALLGVAAEHGLSHVIADTTKDNVPSQRTLEHAGFHQVGEDGDLYLYEVVLNAQVLDDQGRPEPPLASGEAETLVGFLEYQRATFAWKCSGLDVAGLRATVGVSTMTLGGMLKHLAYYEDHWFSHRMRGNERQALWNDDHWDADPDWEWTSAAQDSPEELHALWQDAVSRSRELLAETLANGGLGQPAGRTFPDGRRPSVRWIVMHMVEEYARHNGHADLIRESLDGLTGE